MQIAIARALSKPLPPGPVRSETVWPDFSKDKLLVTKHNPRWHMKRWWVDI